MRYLLLLLVLSLSSLAQMHMERRGPGPEPDAKPATPPSKKDLKLAAELIQRAQSLSADLNETDRAYVLAKMAELSAKRDPEQSQTWAEEAFRLANRVAGLPTTAGGVVGILTGLAGLAMPTTAGLVGAAVVGLIAMFALAAGGAVLGNRAASAVPAPAPAGCAGCACGGCGVFKKAEA